MLKKSLITSYLFVTILNCIIGIFLLNLEVFLIRQFIFSFLFVIAFIFQQELIIIKKDYLFLQNQLVEKASILKYEYIFYFIFILTIFVSTLKLPENFLFMYFICGIYNFCFLIFSFYKFYLILKDPDMRAYFFNRKSYSLSIHKPGSRPFSSMSITIGKFCLECLKFGGLLGGAYLGIGYGLPKSIYGATYRSPIVDTVGYFFTGLKSNNEVSYSAAVSFVNEYPDSKPNIVESDGCTVSTKKLIKEARKVKYPLLGVEVEEFKLKKNKFFNFI